MARVTIEDCVDKVENRFELVVLAAQRAKTINSGTPITVERENDKYPVIALREIAIGNIKTDVLRQEVLSSYRLKNNIEPIQVEPLENDAENEDFNHISDSSEYAIGEDNLEDYGNGISFEDEIINDEDDK